MPDQPDLARVYAALPKMNRGHQLTKGEMTTLHIEGWVERKQGQGREDNEGETRWIAVGAKGSKTGGAFHVSGIIYQQKETKRLSVYCCITTEAYCSAGNYADCKRLKQELQHHVVST